MVGAGAGGAHGGGAGVAAGTAGGGALALAVLDAVVVQLVAVVVGRWPGHSAAFVLVAFAVVSVIAVLGVWRVGVG